MLAAPGGEPDHAATSLSPMCLAATSTEQVDSPPCRDFSRQVSGSSGAILGGCRRAYRIHRAARRDAVQASGAAASGVTPGPRAAPADAPPTGSMNAGSHTAAGARVLGMGNMARERPVQPGGLNTRTQARTERIFQRRRGVSHVTGD